MPTSRTLILAALKDHLEANVPRDPLDNSKPAFAVRHDRFRAADKKETPCVSVRYVSRDLPGVTTAADPATADLSLAEEVIEIAVDLIAEAELPSEESGEDPTGLETVGQMLQACMETLFRVGENPDDLGGLLMNIRYDGDSPGSDDELSHPDAARLAERITLVYRARSEYPLGILMN